VSIEYLLFNIPDHDDRLTIYMKRADYPSAKIISTALCLVSSVFYRVGLGMEQTR
jgi:hypothetical protein